MGCDIHPYLEIKVNSKWYYAGHLVENRDYRIFGLLSGVRYSNPEFPDGFFPHISSYDLKLSDMKLSDEVLHMSCLLEGDNGDNHSHTLITYDKMIEFIARFSHKSNLYFVEYWYSTMREFIESGFADDVRIILWYDN